MLDNLLRVVIVFCIHMHTEAAMSAITLEQAQENLSLWIEADKAVSKNQEYYIGDRKLTRADAAVITDKINFWSNLVNNLSARPVSRFTRVLY